MAAKIPADMTEALKMIEHLQSKNEALQKEISNLERVVSNLNEMLQKAAR